jgi:hypothetical protein
MKPLPRRTYHQTLVGDTLAAHLKKSSHRSDSALSNRLRETGEQPVVREGDPDADEAGDASPRDAADPGPDAR